MIANAFSLAATVKILSVIKEVNNIFSIQFGISEVLETLIIPDELYGAFFFFLFFSAPVFLQRCFVNYKTSPTLHRHEGGKITAEFQFLR